MEQKPNIVFLDAYSLGDADLSEIKALGNYTAYENTRKEEVVERAKDAEVIITNKVMIDRAAMEQLPKLRLIAISATGLNNVDLDAAKDLGITVKNAIGYSTHAVTETTIGAALALYRQIPYYDEYTKEEYAHQDRQFHFGRPVRSLYGKRWGIIGLGNIGHAVAKVATALGCAVAYTSTSGITREEIYPAKTLTELLTWADIISIHCPLNAQTHNLISAPELESMHRSAILINVARGGIVNEAALAEGLNRNELAGAALDVFTEEPLTESNPLFKVQDPRKLILSPHNAWAAEEAVKVLVECIRDNIRNFYA